MTLDEWMTRNEVADEKLAAAVRTHRTTISRIRRGEQRPSWDLAERIIQHTNEAVTYPALAGKKESAA